MTSLRKKRNIHWNPRSTLKTDLKNRLQRHVADFMDGVFRGKEGQYRPPKKEGACQYIYVMTAESGFSSYDRLETSVTTAL